MLAVQVDHRAYTACKQTVPRARVARNPFGHRKFMSSPSRPSLGTGSTRLRLLPGNRTSHAPIIDLCKRLLKMQLKCSPERECKQSNRVMRQYNQSKAFSATIKRKDDVPPPAKRPHYSFSTIIPTSGTLVGLAQPSSSTCTSSPPVVVSFNFIIIILLYDLNY